MPLQFAREPEQATLHLNHGLKNLTSFKAKFPQRYRTTDLDNLQVQPPFEVFGIPLGGTPSGGDIESVTNGTFSAGFIYMVNNAQGAVAAIQISPFAPMPGIQAHRLTHIFTGPFVLEISNLLISLQSHPLLLTNVFEARLLRCSPLHLMAIWLRPVQDGEDMIFPLKVGNHPLIPWKMHTPEVFIKAIKATAQEVVRSQSY